MQARLRDARGRFMKRPKAPLDPDLVKNLRAGQPLGLVNWAEIPIALELVEVTRPAVGPAWKVTRRDEDAKAAQTP